MPSAETPCFPTELIELVLSALWSSILSVQDRRTLLASLPLVNHTWNSSFRLVQRMSPTPKELHIVSLGHALDFIHVLRNGISKLSSFPTLSEIQCISIIIPGPRITLYDPHTFPSTPPMCVALTELLRAFSECPNRLPNLRALRVDFWNIPLDDAVSVAQLKHFPPQIRELQMRFGFEEGTPMEWMGRMHDVGSNDFYVSQLAVDLTRMVADVQHVILVDASKDVVMQVSRVFQNARVTSSFLL